MRLLFGLLLACALSQFAAEIGTKAPNPSLVRIVAVRPTPEPTNVETAIVFPRQEQVLWGNPVRVQARLIGFSVGTNSDFEREHEIFNDPGGQSLLIFIDDHHPVEIYKSTIDSLDNNNLFYDVMLTTRIPFHLKEGKHVIRAFPDRSYGESLKGPGCYAASIFYIGSRMDNLDVDLRAPYMTYNEPLETMRYRSDRPLLLDFYLSNVQLSPDGYKIKVTIDGEIIRSLTRWVPYYIYGLTPGVHTVRLQLIDGQNKQVPGLFNDVTRKVTLD